MPVDFSLKVVLIMSHDEDFKDSSSLRHLLIAFMVFLFVPLLPMLMGWLTVLG